MLELLNNLLNLLGETGLARFVFTVAPYVCHCQISRLSESFPIEQLYHGLNFLNSLYKRVHHTLTLLKSGDLFFVLL